MCNPGAAALKAAADPEKTDVKYFVRNDVKNDGSHVFSRTLAEHEANRARYSRQ
ncbi:MAG TPA: endolytic transglycosylase MltG [Chloroflexota bacterium]|nr:endolytic transglycosylase MltG [Chloroflexota bacterium]